MLEIQVADATALDFIVAKEDGGGTITYLRADRKTWTVLRSAAGRFPAEEVLGEGWSVPLDAQSGGSLRLVPAGYLQLLRFAEIGRQALLYYRPWNGARTLATVQPGAVLLGAFRTIADKLEILASIWRQRSPVAQVYAAELLCIMREVGLVQEDSDSQHAGVHENPHRRASCATEPQGGPAGAKAGSPPVRGSRKAYLFAYLTKGQVRRVGYCSEEHPSVFGGELPLLLLESDPCPDFEAAILDLQAKLKGDSLLYLWLCSVQGGEVSMDSEVRRWISLSSERA